MSRISYYLSQFIEWFKVSDIRIGDIIEIIIITYIIYKLMVWLKDTKAISLMRGLIILALFLGVAVVFNMQTILWLAKTLGSILAVALVIIFQPELRKALEQLGEKKFLRKILSFQNNSDDKKFSDIVKRHILEATFDMGEVKTGALIVIENHMDLSEYTKTGIELDALVTKQLLINIFEHNTPLHDGAVIIKKDRIVAATCYLPLSNNLNLSKELGTRHRSAIGLSEVCDAIVIVASEETGEVSVSQNGKIYRDVTRSELLEYLDTIQKDVITPIVQVGRSKDEESAN